MHIAPLDLKLDHLYLIHPHQMTFLLDAKITAVGLEDIKFLYICPCNLP